MKETALTGLVALHREDILAAEQYIWQHPESGYKEWNTHAYMKDIFEKAGYTVTEAGDIPGFYTDIETGRPGPKVLIMAELDALTAPDHPAAVNGCAHACGHHAQCAAMVGMALALKEPGALDGLSGSVRLMLVPAEELIELEFRKELRRQGVIRYLGGKTEFLHRGYMDGVDLAFMFHAWSGSGYVFEFKEYIGLITKEIVYEGKAAHAGAAPHEGINALYAANQGLNAINALRETFRDDDRVRVHPVLNVGDVAVNIIPPKAKMAAYVRSAAVDVMRETNRKVNRALASGALALGAKVHVTDDPGYAPLSICKPLQELAVKCLGELVGADRVGPLRSGSGSTDMGDISCVIRAIHPHVAGASGAAHGDDYRISDPETACVTSAKAQLSLMAALLEKDAAAAKEIMAASKPLYESKEAFFAAMDELAQDRDLVEYTEDGANILF